MAQIDENASFSNGALEVTTVQAVNTGLTLKRVMAGASTNANNVKGSGGNVYAWYFANNAAYDVFFKFFNKATSPTVGTDTPVFTLKVPTGGVVSGQFPAGIWFSAGISYSITKLVADSDTTVLAANDLTGFFQYI